MGLRLNEFSPFRITKSDSGEKPSHSLADRGECLASISQREDCKVGRIIFKTLPGICCGLWEQGPTAGGAEVVHPHQGGAGWDEVRVQMVPSSVAPRAGQGLDCGGLG